MDEVQKVARRSQINTELNPLRHRRDDNISVRNRLIEQLERLESARSELRNCIGYLPTIERNMKNCHQNTPDNQFKGKRRERLVECMMNTGGNIGMEMQRHQQNLERLETHINSLRNRRDEMIRTINGQNNRITTLEAELRTLR